MGNAYTTIPECNEHDIYLSILRKCDENIKLHDSGCEMRRERYRSYVRQAVGMKRKLSLHNLNCDACDIQLIEPKGKKLLSHPVCYQAVCAGCGLEKCVKG